MIKSLLKALKRLVGAEALYGMARQISQEGMAFATPVFDGADYQTEIRPTLERVGLVCRRHVPYV